MLKDLLNLLKKGSLMEQAFRETIEMINVLETMFQDSVNYLHEGTEPEKDRDVYMLDKRINLLEQKLRRHIYNHLVLTEHKDLYMSLILVQIGVDLERVGDYIKNIYDLRRIAGELDFHTHRDELLELEKAVKSMIPKIRQALEENDDMLATQVQKDFFERVKLCDQRVEEYLKEEVDMESRKVAGLALYYRYLKRILAHFINVASAISNPYDRIGFHPDDII